jgi:hypothetical protein
MAMTTATITQPIPPVRQPDIPPELVAPAVPPRPHRRGCGAAPPVPDPVGAWEEEFGGCSRRPSPRPRPPKPPLAGEPSPRPLRPALRRPPPGRPDPLPSPSLGMGRSPIYRVSQLRIGSLAFEHQTNLSGPSDGLGLPTR